MTPEQEKQWNDYACTPRCLIKLAELNGHPITADEFCSRFEQLFINPSERYGWFPTGKIWNTLPSLQLPGHAADSADYSAVQSALNSGQLVLMMSHVNLDPGETGELNHCSVLTRMDENGFTIWTPTQNAGDIYEDHTKADWTDKKCWGYILK